MSQVDDVSGGDEEGEETMEINQVSIEDGDNDDQYENNEENQELVGLIDHETESNVEESAIAMMVRVRAPATLPEGYTFVAEVNEDPLKTFTCRVVSTQHCIMYPAFSLNASGTQIITYLLACCFLHCYI